MGGRRVSSQDRPRRLYRVKDCLVPPEVVRITRTEIHHGHRAPPPRQRIAMADVPTDGPWIPQCLSICVFQPPRYFEPCRSFSFDPATIIGATYNHECHAGISTRCKLRSVLLCSDRAPWSNCDFKNGRGRDVLKRKRII